MKKVLYSIAALLGFLASHMPSILSAETNTSATKNIFRSVNWPIKFYPKTATPKTLSSSPTLLCRHI